MFISTYSKQGTSISRWNVGPLSHSELQQQDKTPSRDLREEIKICVCQYCSQYINRIGSAAVFKENPLSLKNVG